MASMRFDPFRELDRLVDQAVASARSARTLPMEAFALKPLAWAATVIYLLIFSALLSGCGAGQQTQTATMQPAVNGVMVTLNDVGLHNIRIRVVQTGAAVQPGRSVDLAMVATNQSPDTADAIIGVTSDIGRVTFVGNVAIPAGGTLIVDSPDRQVYASALGAVKPLNIATATVILTQPVTNGLLYRFTFQFARAGETPVDVPVSSD